MRTPASNIVVTADLRARLDKLHDLYGHDQSLKEILDGLNTRLVRARQIYGPERSLPAVVSGLYDQLDELRQLYGAESIEGVLASIIDRKKRLNRLVELRSKVMVTDQEHHEIRYLERMFKRYVYSLTREKAQERAILTRNGTANGAART